MNVEDALFRLAAVAPAVKAMGATSLYLFGSTARGEAGPESDLDLFIDHDPLSPLQRVRPRWDQAIPRGRIADAGRRRHARRPASAVARQDRARVDPGVLMERDLAPALHDILQTIERVESVTSGKTLEEFSADWRLS
jgi:hypothetical protein